MTIHVAAVVQYSDGGRPSFSARHRGEPPQSANSFANVLGFPDVTSMTVTIVFANHSLSSGACATHAAAAALASVSFPRNSSTAGSAAFHSDESERPAAARVR